MDAAAYAKIFPKEHLRKFLEEQTRVDGRSHRAVRKCAIATSTLSTADGSAMAKVGRTSVMCGIKLEVGTPDAGSLTSGRIVVDVDIPSLCSANLPASTAVRQTESVALAEFLSKVVNSSGMIDLTQLGITEGSAVWVLYADLVCVDYDGNLNDACLLALVHALADVQLPQTQIGPDNQVYIVDTARAPPKPLSLAGFPYPLTFAIIDEFLLVDPRAEEEALAQSVFTVVHSPSGYLLGMHKTGGAALSPERLQACLVLGAGRAKAWSTVTSSQGFKIKEETIVVKTEGADQQQQQRVKQEKDGGMKDKDVSTSKSTAKRGSVFTLKPIEL